MRLRLPYLLRSPIDGLTEHSAYNGLLLHLLLLLRVLLLLHLLLLRLLLRLKRLLRVLERLRKLLENLPVGDWHADGVSELLGVAGRKLRRLAAAAGELRSGLRHLAARSLRLLRCD